MEAPVFLLAQGIDDDDGVVDRVRHAHGLRNDDRGVGRGQGLNDASEEFETKTEASSIKGQHWRLRRGDDRPEEFATMAEALEEEDDPEVLAITAQALAEEAEKTTRPSARL